MIQAESSARPEGEGAPEGLVWGEEAFASAFDEKVFVGLAPAAAFAAFSFVMCIIFNRKMDD